MIKKLLVVAAGATGYVLGARAGRERYEQIVARAKAVRQNPAVQDAAETARQTAADTAPVVKDKVAAAASDVAGKVKDAAPSRGGSSSGDDLPGTTGNPAEGAHG